METGIMAIQNTVSHPFTRRMNTGSPWIEAHSDLTTAPIEWGLYPRRNSGNEEERCTRTRRGRRSNRANVAAAFPELVALAQPSREVPGCDPGDRADRPAGAR